jgi:hypothetical protein
MRYGGISAKFMSNINVLIVNRRSLEIPDAGQRATSFSNNNVPNTYKKKNKNSFTKSSFHSRFKLAHSCHKKPNLHTNELDISFFCSTSPLKAPNRLKSLKLA